MKKLVLGTAAALGSVALISHLSRTWGATREERAMELPGDEHVQSLDATATRAITIQAPPEKVWPWLMQMGQDRGGFYSYAVLENAIGCEIDTVHELRPEWSSREDSEPVPLAPQISLKVLEVIPGRALVLSEGDADYGDAAGLPSAFTWAFVLLPAEEGTRLVIRERYEFEAARDKLSAPLVMVASWVMTEKMLRTLRDLAEGEPGEL